MLVDKTSLFPAGTHGQVNCFGKFTVHLSDALYGRGAHTITRFRTQKTASLLAFLIFYGNRTHTREFLIDTFWPDASLDNGRQSLSTSLTSLRAQLEPIPLPEGAVFVTDRFNIGIRAGTFTTDASEFVSFVKRAEQAARRGDSALFYQYNQSARALYAMPLFDGMSDEWIVAAQAEMEEIFAKLERLTDQMGRFGSTRNVPGVSPMDSINPTIPAESVKLDSQIYIRHQDLDARATHISTPRRNRLWASQNTPFFGREEEMASIMALLADRSNRLLTMTGAGGVGKTRLSVRIAEKLIEVGKERMSTGSAYPSPQLASYVSLAEISGANTEEILPITIFEAIADPSEKIPGGRVEVLEWLTEYLRGMTRPVLFLDNAEQIVVEVAELVDTLLRRVSELTLVVTSRQRLGVDGEQVFPIHPLPLPPVSHASDLVGAGGVDPGDAFYSIRNSPSVALFVDRARAHRPDFRLTGQNAASIVRLVTYLEGIPLALELAAGWVQVLTPEKMISVKGGRFSLLKKGGSNHQRQRMRHGSVLNTLAWGFDLLTPQLQKALTCLSVFRGSFQSEAAETVLDLGNSDAFEVFDILARLTDASLIQSYEAADECGIRFCMLETIREFAATHLQDSESADLHRAHAQYYLTFIENLETPTTSRLENMDWREKIEREEDNMRAALDWTQIQADKSSSESSTSDALLNIRLTMALYRYWLMYGRISEGRRRFETALGLVDALRNSHNLAVSYEAQIINRTGVLIMTQGDAVKAQQFFEKSLALCMEHDDTRGVGAALNNLAILASRRQDFDLARRYYEQSLQGFRKINDEQNIGVVLANLGGIANDAGDLARACVLLTESVETARHSGSGSALATRLRNLSEVFYKQGDLAKAAAGYRESLELTKNTRDAVGAAFSLLGVGFVSAARGESQETEANKTMLQTAIFYLNSIHVPLPDFQRVQAKWLQLNDQVSSEDAENAENMLWRVVDTTAFDVLAKIHSDPA